MPCDVYKVRDTSDSYHISVEDVPNLPCKIAITGRSQLSGKTNLLVNLLTRPNLYGKHFKGDDIYLFSPSLHTPKLKSLIKYKKIPQTNCLPGYDEEQLKIIYEFLKEEFDDGNTDHKILCFDDCGFDGRPGMNSFLNDVILACRHYNISLVFLVQKYIMLSPTFRSNMTGLMAFPAVMSEVEHIAQENNTTGTKKNFIKKFQEVTSKPHSFMQVDYTKCPTEGRYRDNLKDPIIID